MYLTELTNVPTEAQGMLLGAMRDGAVRPLGADKPVKADVRIIAATQGRDLLGGAPSAEVREDLYYALAVMTIEIPPLRERGTDILRLAETFLREFRERYDRPGVTMSTEFKQALTDCAWPGNVRQLRNAIEHALVMCPERQLHVASLPEEILVTRWTRSSQELTEEVIRAALKRTHGNRGHAAELLGIGRTTLWRAMKRMGIE